MFKITDPLDTIKTVLDAGWDDDNTDSITPTVKNIVEVSEANFAGGDFIFLYLVDGAEDAFGIGGTGWMDKPVVAVDIRTTYKRTTNDVGSIRDHMIKIKDEVRRLIRASLSNPDANFLIMKIRRYRDLSDKSKMFGRWVFDVQLENYGA